MIEGKGGEADRGRRLSLLLSLHGVSSSIGPQCHSGLLQQQSSFEVIMGLLANAPLQVPLAPSPSLSPSTATEMRRDENPFKVHRWGQSFFPLPPLLLSSALSASPTYSIPTLFIALQALSVTLRSFYCPLTQFPLLPFSVCLLDWIAALQWISEGGILNYPKKQFKVYEGEKRKKKINFPSCINNNQNMFYIPLPPWLHFSSTALLSFILSAFKLCLHLLLNQYSKPFSSSSSFSSGRVRCQIGVTAGLLWLQCTTGKHTHTHLAASRM